MEQESRYIYVYRRKNKWLVQGYDSGEIYFESIDYAMPIDEIYHRVIFQAA